MGRNFIYIDKDAELKHLIRDLQKADSVALDTEADSLHHYFEKVCLIQLSIESRDYIVDPLSGLSLSRFLETLSRKKLLLHGGDFDLRMLRSSYGFEPKREVFDTMIAAQVLGYPQIGLAYLVERICGVKLSKTGQKSNWARRPLTPDQLVYASDDTHYLAQVVEKIEYELGQLKRQDWHKEGCERLKEIVMKPSKKSVEDAWRIKGSGALQPRILVYLKELWLWRDAQARRVDRPTFMILGNQQLLSLAKKFSENPKTSLSKLSEIPKNCNPARLKALEKAIQKASTTPQGKWPERKKTRKPDEPDCKKELESLRADCKKIAEGIKIDPSYLAPKAALKNILMQRPRSPERLKKVSGLMNWQINLISPCIERALAEGVTERK